MFFKVEKEIKELRGFGTCFLKRLFLFLRKTLYIVLVAVERCLSIEVNLSQNFRIISERPLTHSHAQPNIKFF